MSRRHNVCLGRNHGLSDEADQIVHRRRFLEWFDRDLPREPAGDRITRGVSWGGDGR